MIGFMAGGIILQACVLSLILYYVARHEADYSIAKVAMVVAGITLGDFLIGAFVAPLIGPFSILCSLALIVFMIMTFCWTTMKKTLIVVGIYIAFYLAVVAIAIPIKARFMGKAGETATMVDKQYEEMGAIQEELRRQSMQGGGYAAPAVPDQPVQEVADTDVPATDEPEVADPDVAAPAAAIEPPPVVAVVQPPPEPVPAVVITPDTPAPTAPATAVTPAPPAAPAAPGAATQPAPVAADDAAWREARKKMKIGGVIVGKKGKPTAYVNNNLVEVGDTVSVKHDLQIYRWTVRDITKAGVKLDPLDIRPQ